MKTMFDVYNPWQRSGRTDWNSWLDALRDSSLPFWTDRDLGVYALAADGLWLTRKHTRSYKPMSVFDEESEPFVAEHAGRPEPVRDHHLFEGGKTHVVLEGRHFVHVTNGTICDYDTSEDGYVVWLEDNEGPHPVPFNGEGMLGLILRTNVVQVDELVGMDLWYDDVALQWSLQPLWMEIDPITEARIS